MNINRQYITNINFTDKNSTERIKYIVIHYFGGLSTAENLAAYWAREYAGASAHYAIGHEGEIFQIVEDDDIAWHCGAKNYIHPTCRNSNSIGIEMAVKKENVRTQNATDKDWYFTPQTVAAAVELTRQLMKKYNVPAENVLRHYDVTGKICPNPYYYNLYDSTWQTFKAAISAPDESSTAAVLTPIMGKAQADAKQIAAYLVSKNTSAVSYAAELATIYIEEGCAEGVRGDVAAAQSMIETGNFIFAGSAVTLDQNNFCGMGVTACGMKGNSFATMREGVRAQIQHLKAYATADPLIGDCVDPRYKWVEKGCAPYVEWLGQKENPKGKGWAAGADYGAKIKRVLSAMIENADTEEKTATGGAQNATQGEKKTEVKANAGSLKIIYKGADGVNYRAIPDYNAAAAGQAHAGEVYTVVGETEEFYKLKSGWYITKRADLVQFTKKEVKRYAKIIYKGADGVNYRAVPDYNAAAAGQVYAGEVFTVVEETEDFYKLKAGWYLTKRKDLVELIEIA
ncbi:MAG: hypothetical protein HDR09_20005 [Lachnospiraceae bacterium]|nr:hypothetical protein [Lachnospiraceae bacterium]MBD5505960.1 hypothetical protein [Lachnospiraceae bacterium]